MGKRNPANFRDFVRCEYYNAADDPYQGNDQIATMYRDERFKLVVYHGHGLGELFDMVNDAGEFHNLWDRPEHSQLKFDLLWRSYDATAMAQDWGAPRVAGH